MFAFMGAITAEPSVQAQSLQVSDIVNTTDTLETELILFRFLTVSDVIMAKTVRTAISIA
jgi:hypothetical protein